MITKNIETHNDDGYVEALLRSERAYHWLDDKEEPGDLLCAETSSRTTRTTTTESVPRGGAEDHTKSSVDVEILERFFVTMRGADAEVFFECLHEDPTKGSKRIRTTASKIHEHADRLSQLASDGWSIYFVAQRTDGSGNRRAENISGIWEVYLDLDGSPISPILDLKAAKPTAIVETSPDRYHVHWKCETTAVEGGQLTIDGESYPVEFFSQFLGEIAQQFEADEKVKDLPRLLRPPGVPNNKAGRNGFPTKLVQIDESPNVVPWPLKSLMSALGHNQIGVRKKEEDQKAELPQNAADPLCIPKGERNAALTREGARLLDAGWTYSNIAEALKILNTQFEPPMAPNELHNEVTRIIGWLQKKPRGKALKSLRIESPPKQIVSVPWETTMVKEFPEKQFIINGLLPPGLTILSGDPKRGKTCMIQQAVFAVVEGRNFLGCKEWAVTGGDVLFLALEDMECDLLERHKRMANTYQPINGNTLETVTIENLADFNSYMAFIEQWAERVKNPRLVATDTLEHLLNGAATPKNSNAYKVDVALLTPIQVLAKRLGVAITALHHLNKNKTTDSQQRISGSMGIAGTADATWNLDRPPGDRATLITSGRWIPTAEYNLAFNSNTLSWKYLGDAGKMAKAGVEQACLDIMDSAERAGKIDGFTAAEMAVELKAVGESRNEKTVRKLFQDMLRRGLLENIVGNRHRFRLP